VGTSWKPSAAQGFTQLKVGALHSHEPLLLLQDLRLLTFRWDENTPKPCGLAAVTQLLQLKLFPGTGVRRIAGIGLS
jgi:hypothetical protein